MIVKECKETRAASLGLLPTEKGCSVVTQLCPLDWVEF